MADQPLFNHIPEWLGQNQRVFAPPACSKLMHGPNGQLFVMFVGGPNQVSGYHLEEGEELFYMIKGDMCLNVQEQGTFKGIPIKQGEIFLLPGRILHSPQRYANTVGWVIERKRLETEEDCVRYFMDDQENTLFERWLHCYDLGTQIAPVIKEFLASPEKASGKPTDTSIEPSPPYVPNKQCRLEPPFSLANWLADHKEEIQNLGKVRVFAESDYHTDVFVVGRSEKFAGNADAEYWVWQVSGEADLLCDEGKEGQFESLQHRLAEDCAFLVPCGKDFELQVKYVGEKPSYTLVVMMNPANKARVTK